MEAVSQRSGVLIIRPFLSLPKQVLVDALSGESYRSDETNSIPVCQRNRLRLQILPMLTAENPAAVAHIARSAALLQLDEDYLQTQADALLKTCLIDKPPYFCLHRVALQDAPAAIALRTLRKFAELGLLRCGASTDERSLSAQDSLTMLELLNAPEYTVINLPGALHAMATRRFIHLTRMDDDAPLQDVPPATPVALTQADAVIAFGDITLLAAPFVSSMRPPDGHASVVLTEDQRKAAVLRTPLPGDTIRPFGASGQKPLRRYLTGPEAGSALSPLFACTRHRPRSTLGCWHRRGGKHTPFKGFRCFIHPAGHSALAQSHAVKEYTMKQDCPMFQDLSEILISEEQIKHTVQSLGERVTQDYQGKNPLMICILKGSTVFFTDLIRDISLPLDIDFMAISSYGSNTVSGEVRLVKDLDTSIEGRNVLIVEDIVDSGKTLAYLKRILNNRGAASIRIITLLDKPSRRVVPLSVDYTGFEIPDAFVVGYGLDYNEKYRNLPVIGVLDEKIYK